MHLKTRPVVTSGQTSTFLHNYFKQNMLNRIIILFFASVVLLFSCTRNRDFLTGPEEKRETGQTPEYLVYSAVLSSFQPSQALELVLNDSTVFYDFSKNLAYIKSHFPDAMDETLYNYLAINTHNISLLDIPDVQVTCHVLSSAKSNQWKSLFPNANALIHVSQVGFNTVKDQAILYLSEYVAPLSASGHLYFLNKEAAGWHVSKSVMLWIS
jgi:hypothetical protein